MEGKLIADKYLIGKLIRESDAGDLYAGLDELRGTAITLEILPMALSVDSRWTAKFIDRLRSARAVKHPAIPELRDLGTDSKGTAYAVYDQIAGSPLKNLEQDLGQIGQARALTIAKRTADGLAAAQTQDIIHGKLDPNDIFITDGDHVKIFGIGGDRLNVAHGADIRYLAPEQCTDYPAADERSDVYSLAVILYEMLAGEVPFSGRNLSEIRSAQDQPPKPLSEFRQDLHNRLEPVLLTALAKDPDLRYQTMSLFGEDLARIANDLGVKVKATAASAGAAQQRNVWQTAFIALIAMVALASVFVYATWTRSSDPTTTTVADPDSLPVQPINPATGAQEEAMLKNAPLGDPAALNDPYLQNGQLPGGDGYNAWANGGLPQAGAPLSGVTTGPLAGSQIPQTGGALPPQAIAPPGQTITIPPGGGSVFMPNEGGVILVPVPRNEEPAANTAQGKHPNSNTSVKPAANPGPTPKPMATPQPRQDPSTAPADTKAGGKPATKPSTAKPGKKGTTDEE